MEALRSSRYTHLPLLVVNHHVVRLDVSVHDAARMAEVERFEQLKDVVSHVVVAEFRVEDLEVGVVDVLEDNGGCFRLHCWDRRIKAGSATSSQAEGRGRRLWRRLSAGYERGMIWQAPTALELCSSVPETPLPQPMATVTLAFNAQECRSPEDRGRRRAERLRLALLRGSAGS